MVKGAGKESAGEFGRFKGGRAGDQTIGAIKDSAGHVAGPDRSRQSDGGKSTMWMRMICATSGTAVAQIVKEVRNSRSRR